MLSEFYSNLLFDYNSGIENVIRVLVKIKSFNDELNIIMMNI
jgi:hypothetical protein